MANLDFVTPHLATGGDLPYDKARALLDLEEWRRLGITHVLDNRLEWSDAALVAEWAPAIRYLHIGVDDIGERMPDTWFDKGVEFVLDTFATPGAKVLVHCHMGINRGPSLAYAALLATGWDPVAALDAIRSARPIAGLGYAEEALDWHHRRKRVSQARRSSDRRRVASWRQKNWIDVVRIIRSIRATEECNSSTTGA